MDRGTPKEGGWFVPLESRVVSSARCQINGVDVVSKIEAGCYGKETRCTSQAQWHVYARNKVSGQRKQVSCNGAC